MHSIFDHFRSASQTFGTEVIIIHGGINSKKEALSDLSALSVEQQEFLELEQSAVGPAARAFHAACCVGHRVFIFGGHVFLPEQRRLHQFNDLWALDTVRPSCKEGRSISATATRSCCAVTHLLAPPLCVVLQNTWQWHRQDAAPEGPLPVARDRAALVAMGKDTLVLFGGADAMNRRLDDVWTYDLIA